MIFDSSAYPLSNHSTDKLMIKKVMSEFVDRIAKGKQTLVSKGTKLAKGDNHTVLLKICQCKFWNDGICILEF